MDIYINFTNVIAIFNSLENSWHWTKIVFRQIMRDQIQTFRTNFFTGKILAGISAWHYRFSFFNLFKSLECGISHLVFDHLSQLISFHLTELLQSVLIKAGVE